MLSALLVDDEPPANERLRTLLAAAGGIEVVGVAASVQEARALLLERTPDVVFLDVEMPGATGLELLPSVADSTQVVFVTAHEAHALDAFAAGALDYLMKPVDVDRLSETVRRLTKMVELLQRRAAGQPVADGERETDAAPGLTGPTPLGLASTITVPLQSKGRTAAVSIGDICWIEGLRNYTRVALRNPGRIMLFRRRLGEWERDLPGDAFERLGKSLLVQVAVILETEWISRDETLVRFAADLEPLVIGRLAATRLREVLARGGTDAGPTVD